MTCSSQMRSEQRPESQTGVDSETAYLKVISLSADLMKSFQGSMRSGSCGANALLKRVALSAFIQTGDTSFFRSGGAASGHRSVLIRTLCWLGYRAVAHWSRFRRTPLRHSDEFLVATPCSPGQPADARPGDFLIFLARLHDKETIYLDIWLPRTAPPAGHYVAALAYWQGDCELAPPWRRSNKGVRYLPT